MKQISLIILFLLTVTITHAQIKTGHISYSAEISSENPDLKMAIDMMKGTKMDIYFDQHKTRLDLDMSIMGTTVISNSKDEKVLMLLNSMGVKFAVPISVSELEELEKQTQTTEPKVVLEEGTKEILGYTCKKAVVTDAQGNTSTCWYTEEISFDKSGQNINKDVPGALLEYSSFNQGMKITFMATEFNENFEKESEDLFSLEAPAGYDVKTMEELMNMGM
ncbi:hypothetical protein KH5_18850 [Urechidicola sp. KH5]